MITKVSHQIAGTGPAALSLALSVAYELHAPAAPAPRPTPAPRSPEVAVPELMGLRTSADRPHRRKVPLRRLNTVRGLAALTA